MTTSAALTGGGSRFGVLLGSVETHSDGRLAMRTSTLLVGTLVIGLSLGCVAGCGGGRGAADGPKTYPVTGTVTQGGKPVEGATILFVSVDGKKSATGKTDSSGRYTLTTVKSGDGAVAGQYKVAITKFDTGGGGAVDMSDPNYAPPDPSKPAPVAKNLLPEKYASPDKSGLTATVKESSDNKIDFTVD